MIFWSILATNAGAMTCYPPRVPFVPGDLASQLEFKDLIRQDFEGYIADVQGYFRCLDAERARAFEEAQTVSEQYRRFLQDTSE